MNDKPQGKNESRFDAEQRQREYIASVVGSKTKEKPSICSCGKPVFIGGECCDCLMIHG